MEQIEEDKLHRRKPPMVRTVKEVSVAAIRDTKTRTWTNWMTRNSARSMPLASNKNNLRSKEEALDQNPAPARCDPVKCWYCKKLGQMQKESRSRLQEGAPEVNALECWLPDPAGPPGTLWYTPFERSKDTSPTTPRLPSMPSKEMKVDYQNGVNHLN